MKKIDLTLSLNPYVAFLVVAVVGSGATLAILRAIDVSGEFAAYAALP